MTDPIAIIDPAAVGPDGIFRGRRSDLTWVDDVAPGPLVSGSWLAVQDTAGRPGAAYILLADPDTNTLNLAVAWEQAVPQVIPLAEAPPR